MTSALLAGRGAGSRERPVSVPTALLDLRGGLFPQQLHRFNALPQVLRKYLTAPVGAGGGRASAAETENDGIAVEPASEGGGGGEGGDGSMADLESGPGPGSGSGSVPTETMGEGGAREKEDGAVEGVGGSGRETDKETGRIKSKARKHRSVEGVLQRSVLEGMVRKIDNTYRHSSRPRALEGTHPERLPYVLKEQCVLFAEPTRQISGEIELMAEVAFETAQTAAVASVRKASLCSSAFGRSTCMVVETGPLGTTCAPVFEGYTLTQNVHQWAVGGLLQDLMVACSTKLYNPSSGLFAESFQPFYGHRRKPLDLRALQSASVPASARIDPRYLHLARRQVVDDMKRFLLNIREANTSQTQSHTNTHTQEGRVGREGRTEFSATGYELPDGQTVELGTGTSKSIAEFMFNPDGANEATDLLRTCGSADELSTFVTTWPGMANAVATSAFGCELELLPALMANVVVAGGPSSAAGFVDRVASDAGALSHANIARRHRPWATAGGFAPSEGEAAPSPYDFSRLKPKVSAQSQLDRPFTSWVGGSIIASLDSFKPFWITRAEWDECGSGVMRRRQIL